MSSFRYRAFGLDISSEVPLPELRRAIAPSKEPDVWIRNGEVSGSFEKSAVEFEQDRFRLCIPSVGRFEVSAGRRIVVEALQGQSSSQVRAYLLGSALGALFHQREVLCLHASVVASGDSAVAIIGESGAGKSTLALKLADAGYTFLCDDLCAVEFDDCGTPITWPGLRRLKLWSTTLEATGRATTGLEQVEAKGEKYHLPVDEAAPDKPHRLSAVFVLQKSDGGGSHLTRLSGMSAVTPLVSNTFRGSMISGGGNPEAHFRSCVALAERCHVFNLRRRWDLAEIDDSIRLLEPVFAIGRSLHRDGKDKSD